MSTREEMSALPSSTQGAGTQNSIRDDSRLLLERWEPIRLATESDDPIVRRQAAIAGLQTWRSLPHQHQDHFVRFLSAAWRYHSSANHSQRLRLTSSLILSIGRRLRMPAIEAEGHLARGVFLLMSGSLDDAIS